MLRDNIQEHENIKFNMKLFVQELDSSWTLIEISRLKININQYKCIKGSQYVPQPPEIQRKHPCINV